MGSVVRLLVAAGLLGAVACPASVHVSAGEAEPLAVDIPDAKAPLPDAGLRDAALRDATVIPPDAGRDAGEGVDASSPRDASVAPDATRPDAAVRVDAGIPLARWTADPTPDVAGYLSLRAVAVTTERVTFAVDVTTPIPVFGAAVRLEHASTVLRMVDVTSCGGLDGAGPAPRTWREVGPGQVWVGIASASRQSLLNATQGACLLLVTYDVVAPGTTRVDLVPSRSAAVGPAANTYATSAVAGGLLEVTP
ncbi:MAG: hypothetical protein AB2A00_24030 [Myxococcota bacterium]